MLVENYRKTVDINKTPLGGVFYTGYWLGLLYRFDNPAASDSFGWFYRGG